MSKRMLYVLLAAVFAIALTACGSSDEDDAAEAEEQETNQEENETEEDSEEKAEEPEQMEEEVENEDASSDEADAEQEAEEDADEEEQAQAESSNADFDALITAMEEETEGTATLLYENDEPQSHEMEGLTVTLDAYQLVELEDFHTNFSIPFNDETDGGVILAQYTVENDSDQDLHYMPSLDLDFVGATKFYTNYRELLPLDEQLSSMLNPDNEYLVESGDEVTGYYAYPFGSEDLEAILAEGNVILNVPTPTTEYNEYSSSIGSGTEFSLPLDGDSAEKNAETESQGFYQDALSAENMGDKEMIEQEDGIGESDELGDVTITLDGYQFVDFTPNAEEAARYEDPDNIVVATIRFEIDNQGDEEIGLSSLSSRLTVNDGSQYLLSEGMFHPYDNSSSIASGEEGELLQTFLLDKEMYEKIWKDKSMEIEIGPMRNMDAEDISKGHEVEFNLK
ncbi:MULTISPECIES: DUF5068 domain-containing protein [Oceanobacillus]|uniref:DUF5068 domain-containing protein n=1 Tax=Oceanobacillus TaxID=182709 RepID=UPI002116B4E4|nr:DUF5068 domain-containing protein [Oceanobacillus oncorhynchi]UUI38341.1 DUF5068 domain-containing protein [Oceanobacillus oncorhynchi]